MKTTLRRKLNSLWRGELAAVLVLIAAYSICRVVWGAQAYGNYTLLALLTLSIILLQGSAYWRLKLRQLNGPHAALDSRLLQFGYVFNMALLLTFPAALTAGIINGTIEDSLRDVEVGGGLYLFALAEFVHYFLVKLVRSADDQRARARRRQVSARWMRELQRSEARKEAR